MIFRGVAFLAAILVFTMPFMAIAQNSNEILSDAEQAVIDGTVDAKAHTNQSLWVLVGCTTNIFALACLLYTSPSPRD